MELKIKADRRTFEELNLNKRCPIKSSTKEFRDTIATSIARYEKYRCWASKSKASMTLLDSLGLRATGLSGTILPIASMHGIESIFLQGNRFSGSIPSGMACLKHLQYVFLDDNQISGTALSSGEKKEHKDWDIVGLLQGSKRPLPRKPRKKVRKGVAGASRPRGQKSSKTSRKMTILQAFLRVFGSFSTLFRAFSREAPVTPFRSFSGFSRERPF